MTKSNRSLLLALLAGMVLSAGGLASPAHALDEIKVTAHAETDPIKGDADDPAIWVHPTDASKSLILGTDKKWGLLVYDLDGKQVAAFGDGKLNNVDLRPFILGGEQVWIAGASERIKEELVFYVIDAHGHVAHTDPFAFPPVPDDMKSVVDDIYGFAMQRDPATGRVFALVNYKSGHIFQWELLDQGGKLALSFVTSWRVDSQPEGMVSDDAAGHIYVGEEDVAIWRFPAFPDDKTKAFEVDRIPSACLPEDDVEGLTIYDGAGSRYLVASAQGHSPRGAFTSLMAMPSQFARLWWKLPLARSMA